MGSKCGCDIDRLCGPWGKGLAHEKPTKTSRPIKSNYIPLYIPHDDSGMEINPALIASLVLNVAFIITIIILATAR